MIALPWILVGIEALVTWVILFGLRKSWALILKAIKWYLSGPNILQRIFDPFHISSQPKVHRGEKTLGDVDFGVDVLDVEIDDHARPCRVPDCNLGPRHD